MKTIVPICPRNFIEFRNLLARIGARADWIEIWFDRIENPIKFLEKFAKIPRCKTKFLATCKPPAERGKFIGDPATRTKIFQKFLVSGGNAIDFDIVGAKESEICTFPSDRLFLSFHDFERVPENLPEIFGKMQKFHPKIYKFAVTVNNKTSLEKIMNFAKNFPKKNAIFTTMGAFGVEGRQKLKKYSWARFVALDATSRTATGQEILSEI